MQNNLYRFYWDFRRWGQVEGLFISTQEQVDKLLGKEIYFGEILGKHSEVSGTIDEGDITLVSSDQDKVNWLLELLGGTVYGYNPFDYYEPEEEEDDDKEIDTSS